MRRGNNPLFRANAPESIPHVIATVITHLPILSGYHARRMEIVQACLTSMRKFSGAAVLVWDNGSCEALRGWLREAYQPDYLMLSPNIGKQAARAAIARMLPGETIAGFADDDMLFFPGWLDAHLALLRGFPNVAVVSGWPVRDAFGWGIESTVQWAENNATIERGKFLLDLEEDDYAVSVGLDPADHRRRTAEIQDIRISHGTLTAYAQAQHCQFVGRAGVIRIFAHDNGMCLGGERAFDELIDQAGMLRLTTTKRYTLHMGNIIDDGLARTIKELGL